MQNSVFRFVVTLVVLLLGMPVLAGAAPCESLSGTSMPNVSVTRAQVVAAGEFSIPEGGDRRGIDARFLPTLPAFCRVLATLTPVQDSHIEIEVWLPLANWNGKFLAVGNGGWAGSFPYIAGGRSLADGLRRGYATAATDTGHKDPSPQPGNGRGDAHFAIGHPEKLNDLGYRAVHEMTITAKALIREFYGQMPRLSYWNGCSTGGRQGLGSAQRYPADFDGIIAGAPANYWTHLHAWDLAASVPALKNPASMVPPAKLAMLNKAVLAACDERDGVRDGVLRNPLACTFNPTTLACRAADGPECLTAPQLASVQRMYASAKTSSGAVVFPGRALGSETGWETISEATEPPSVALATFQVAYSNPDWDWTTFDIDRDLKIADERLGPILNAVDPDLAAFKARGGKLLLYHGWNDTAISPKNTIDYYSNVQSRMGTSQDDWMRLFMAPGMEHCANGPGPNRADWVSVLEQWREAAVAPNRIIASGEASGNTVTRPLCPYPQVAVYTGNGSVNEAANFVCKSE